jgi:DNA-binding HxlR family transcriptional regulator
MNVTTSLDASTDCGAVSEILSRVGDKWTVQVVVALRDRPRRFNEIKRHVGGISQQMLTRTLKTLERDGMVKRTVNATTPPQVEYALSPLGRSLSEPVRQLAKWARAHISTIHDNRLRYDATR